jgi:D-alanyl-D-alanine carboxypeptidase
MKIFPRKKLILILFPFALLLAYTAFNIFRTSKNPKDLISPLVVNLDGRFLLKKSWSPANTMLLSRYNPPKITARSALSYDLATNQFVYQKNIYEKLPIASLTKIMTALVAIENEDLGKRIVVDKKSAEIGEDSMGLSAGEILTLEDLLYGLMLHSGNDAAEAIARSSTFGRENFIYLMNKKAQDLGAINTNFTNPSGLEGDGDQYSTAYDLLIITRNALENKVFEKIVSTVEYKIPKTEEHKEYDLFNETNLLTSYPGVRGVKTGFTDEAGYCLVTYLEYGGHRIIAVLLNSKNRRDEMKDLLDYSLRSLGAVPPKHK